MTAKSIMSTELQTLAPDVTVGEAMLIMCANKIHNLPVVDADGSFVGLFSLRRITHALLPMAAQIEPGALNLSMSFVSDQADDYLERLRRIGEQPVSTLLEKRKKLRFCSPDTPIPQLLQLLTENPTSLPVLVVEGEHQKVVGMVSTWDVLTKIAMHLYGDEAQTDSHDEPGEEK
jgi:CBS domain-containing protein